MTCAGESGLAEAREVQAGRRGASRHEGCKQAETTQAEAANSVARHVSGLPFGRKVTEGGAKHRGHPQKRVQKGLPGRCLRQV